MRRTARHRDHDVDGPIDHAPPERRPVPEGSGPQSTADRVLHLQQTAGNRAVQRLLEGGTPVIQRLVYADGRDLAGETLEPMPVNRGQGAHGNLKWNKGTSSGGKKTYNTGFWRLQSDPSLELHVHMGGGGGLTEGGGIAHHFKRGATQKGSIGKPDLVKIFGSENVNSWTKPTYVI
jgi:hypothetical protein